MKIIGIDPSITTSAIYFIDTANNIEYFKIYGKLRRGKWWESVKDVCEQITCEYDYPADYSEQDIYKNIAYGKTAELIGNEIELFKPDLVVIEGYSYSSAAGDLLDLCTFGSALRKSILSKNIPIKILAPTQLKSMAGALAYGLDKKNIARRPIREGEKAGLAAGKFTKKEMLEALICYAPNCSLITSLGPMANEAILLAAIPSPINDMVDAMFLAHVNIYRIKIKI